MKSLISLICGGMMSQSPKIKSLRTKSHSMVFNTWATKVDQILSEIPSINISGEPLEYSDHEWQKGLKQLQQCFMEFGDMPIYPFNEVIANKLIEDQLEGLNEQPDH